eukprot:jgi/Mesvir1/6487/Mv16759-RA.1
MASQAVAFASLTNASVIARRHGIFGAPVRPAEASRKTVLAPCRRAVVAEAAGSSSNGNIVRYGLPLAALAASAAVVGSHTVDASLVQFVSESGVPTIKSLDLPLWALHWFHGINMSIVTLAMGGYGAFLGKEIREGKGNELAALGFGDNKRDLHWKLMAGMTFFFIAGALGGVTFDVALGRDILQSPHAITGGAVLLLLLGQGVLGFAAKGGARDLRNVHTVLGASLMTLLMGHAALGVVLGLSL